MMVNSDIISFIVVIVFSVFLGLLLSFFVGGYALPRYNSRIKAKKLLEKLKKQEEKGFKYYGSQGNEQEFKLSEVIERKLEKNESARK